MQGGFNKHATMALCLGRAEKIAPSKQGYFGRDRSLLKRGYGNIREFRVRI
jgi:hypothetical protein